MQRPSTGFVSPPPMSAMETSPIMASQEFAAVLDYLLKFEIPDKYKDEFEKYKPMLSQALKLANIRRGDIPRYLLDLDIVVLWYKVGQPLTARKRILRMTADLALTCSVDGFQQRAIITTRREEVLEGLNMPKEKEREKRGFSLFKRGGGEE